MRKKSLDNMGFSLVELIVAILIIAIISSGAIVAFGSAWGMKAEAAARNVTDAMKQARTVALGRKNEYNASLSRTDVYAKVYSADGNIYVDICSNEGDTDETESVLHNEIISSDSYQIQVDINYGSTSDSYIVGKDTGSIVYIYFLKSTGGVAGVRVATPGVLGLAKPIEKVAMKVTDSTGYDYQDLILVKLTGRCYIDRASAESGGSGSESGSGG